MWTKGQIIDDMYAELSLAGYVFDLDAEEVQNALRRLDMMMATWDTKGLRLGYMLSSNEESDIGQDSGLPDGAIEAVVLNLALRIAPGKGKVLSQQTRALAKQALDALMSVAAMPSPQQLQGTLPRGAGNRRAYRNNFFRNPVTPLTVADGDAPITY